MRHSNSFHRVGKVVRKNWDEIGIAVALGRMATLEHIDIKEYGYVVEAIRRSRTDLREADIETIQDYIQSLDDSQIPGFVSNIKGIAHEVYFVEAENDDGDEIYAYMYEDTNHATYDVVLYDKSGQELDELQLKATNSEDYINETVKEVGEENILVTSELAEKMGLQSSGISNQQLEADVHHIVDQLVENHSLWEYVPALSGWSISMIIATLTKRYLKGEIDRKSFFQMVGIFAGAKAVKIGVIILALSIPGVNVVAGAALVMKTIFSIRNVYGN